MSAACPSCGEPIKDTAFEAMPDTIVCLKCTRETAFDQLLPISPEMSSDVNYAPPGTSFDCDKNGWTLVASTRSGCGCFLVPFTGVWIALWAWHLGISGFSDYTGVVWLAITTFPVAMSLLMVFGKTRITVTGTTGKVFTGIGPFGWSQWFDWSAIDYAKAEKGGRKRWIALVGTRLTFGSLLNDDRTCYVVRVIRQQIQQEGRIQFP